MLCRRPLELQASMYRSYWRMLMRGRYVQLLIYNNVVLRCRPGAYIKASTLAHPKCLSRPWSYASVCFTIAAYTRRQRNPQTVVRTVCHGHPKLCLCVLTVIAWVFTSPSESIVRILCTRSSYCNKTPAQSGLRHVSEQQNYAATTENGM